MPFTVPKLSPSGRYVTPQSEAKEPLELGQRCLVCWETDPAKYANCTKGDCYPISNEEREPGNFTAPKPLVSAYDLASRMRRKAMALAWEQDELRGKLLSRAKELTSGDYDEVPDEDF